MQALNIKPDLYWTGVLDPDLRVFDIIMETKYGTSYNSYLLKGSKKIALFETSKLSFFVPLEAVARLSGWGTLRNFQLHFTRRTGVAPHEWRVRQRT